MSDNLEQNKTDNIVASVKSVVGIIPFAGPLMSELVGNLIPNQRIDRLTKYAKELEERLQSIEDDKIRNAYSNEEGVDLLEESLIQASRVLTDARRTYIVNVVANGIDDDTIKYSESKYFLKLLQELNEQEVIWLRFYLVSTIAGDKEFREKHKNILEPIHMTMGADKQTVKKHALRESYHKHLERLGLIEPHYNVDSKTGMPERNPWTSSPVVTRHELTSLGKILLKQIGLEESANDS